MAYLAGVLQKDGHRVECVDAVGEGVDQVIEKDSFVYQGLTTEETIDRIPLGSDIIGARACSPRTGPTVAN